MNNAIDDQDYATLADVKSYVAGLLDLRGGYDPTVTSLYPTSANLGSGPSDAVLKGDAWVITVEGFVNGIAVFPGDIVFANNDTADVADDDTLFTIIEDSGAQNNTNVATTTDATVTTLRTINIPADGVVKVETVIIAKDASANVITFKLSGTFYNASGTVALVGDTVLEVDVDEADLVGTNSDEVPWNVQLSPGTNLVTLEVQGALSTTINWKGITTEYRA